MIFNPTVLFEDDFILVVSKPAGMVVNRADTTEIGETLQDWVESRTDYRLWRVEDGKSNNDSIIQNPTSIFLSRSGIAHRLDKETSGVMLIGKTPEALAEFMRQFKERETHKEYLALVHGLVEPKETTINLPIKRSIENRHKFHIDVDGKPAVTRYLVEKLFPYSELRLTTDESRNYQDGFSLVRLFPKTGRTHQIRVHMTHIGYPLVGDELYGGRKRVERDRVWCPRHFLHAAAIEFKHPVSGEVMKVEAPLPEDLQLALKAIKS